MNSKSQSLFNNIIRVLTSNVVVMLASFINTIILPKGMSIDGYAEYQTFMLYISYVGLMTFGFHGGLFIKYGGKKQEEIDPAQFKSEMRVLLISQFVLAIIVGIVAVALKDSLLFAATACSVSMNYVSTYKYLYQAWNKFKMFSLLNIIQALVFSALVFVMFIVSSEINVWTVIGVYFLIDLFCFIFVYYKHFRFVRKSHCNMLLSKENGVVFSNGILMALSGGVNVLFSSMDKYFIKAMFNNYEFSMYCFGITILHLVNAIISAIAQPMYIKLTEVADNSEVRVVYKRILLSLGALAGCAYFVVAFVINMFMDKYSGSLDVVKYLFAIFPVVAVINCMYVNLYKITKRLKKYVIVLAVMVAVSFGLNLFGVLIHKSYISITIATTVSYYIWFIVSSFDFEGLRIELRDILFLVLFIASYVAVATIVTDSILGFAVYLVCAMVLVFVTYGREVIFLIKKVFAEIKRGNE